MYVKLYSKGWDLGENLLLQVSKLKHLNTKIVLFYVLLFNEGVLTTLLCFSFSLVSAFLEPGYYSFLFCINLSALPCFPVLVNIAMFVAEGNCV